jgi:hypothetical protein
LIRAGRNNQRIREYGVCTAPSNAASATDPIELAGLSCDDNYGVGGQAAGNPRPEFARSADPR